MSSINIVAAGYKFKCHKCGKDTNHHLCISTNEIETGKSLNIDGFAVCTSCWALNMLAPVNRIAAEKGRELILKSLGVFQKSGISFYTVPGLYLNKDVLRSYIIERVVMNTTDIIVPLSKISVKSYAAAQDNDVRLTRHGNVYLIATLAKEPKGCSSIPPVAVEHYNFANSNTAGSDVPSIYKILIDVSSWSDSMSSEDKEDTKPLPLIDRTSSLPALTTSVNNTGSTHMSMNTSVVYKPKPTTMYGEWS